MVVLKAEEKKVTTIGAVFLVFKEGSIGQRKGVFKYTHSWGHDKNERKQNDTQFTIVLLSRRKIMFLFI